jgi:hypothetical protein
MRCCFPLSPPSSSAKSDAKTLRLKIRTLNMRMCQCLQEESEAKLLAQMYAKQNDRAMGIFQLQNAQTARDRYTVIKQQYDFHCALLNKLEQALDNKAHAFLLWETNKTLEEILEGTPDAAQVVDAIREQLHVINEHTRELATPIGEEGGEGDNIMHNPITFPILPSSLRPSIKQPLLE